MTAPELAFTITEATQALTAALVAGSVLGLVALLTRVRG